MEKWQRRLIELADVEFIRKQDLGLGADSTFGALNRRGFATEGIRYITAEETLLPAGEKDATLEKCMVITITEAGREEARRLM